ncbi:MAG: DinB family protein [bacterium]
MTARTYPTPELAQWAREWQQTRALTYDLLRVLPYAVMNFSPHPDFGTFIRQIRHAADIQACYVQAIETGTMDFSIQPRQRKLEQSKDQLESYLLSLDDYLLGAVSALTPERMVKPVVWDGEQITVLQLLMRLLQHETLHHGMWAIYAKVVDLPLPESWRTSWSLE